MHASLIYGNRYRYPAYISYCRILRMTSLKQQQEAARRWFMANYLDLNLEFNMCRGALMAITKEMREETTNLI